MRRLREMVSKLRTGPGVKPGRAPAFKVGQSGLKRNEQTEGKAGS